MRLGASRSRSGWWAGVIAAALTAILLQPFLPALHHVSAAPEISASTAAQEREGAADDTNEAPLSPAEDGADDDNDELDALHTRHELASPPPRVATSDPLSHADARRAGHETELDRPPRA